jgi:hypothetical protein
MSDDENLQTIMAITGLDESNAAILLTETGGDLEMASNIFFSGAWEPKSTQSATRDHRDEHEDSQARGKKQRSHEDRFGEEAMRAPIASKVERLYGGGDGFVDPRMAQQASAANYGVDGRPRKAAQPVDIFRDVSESQGGKGKETSLSKLFQLPKDLVFKGGLEMAKMRGEQENKWIILTITTNSNFDSHRLNRDVWSEDFMISIVKGSFLFVQEDESLPEGQRLCTMYRVNKLPATLVLDPLTGSMLLNKGGFVDVERMSEALM